MGHFNKFLVVFTFVAGVTFYSCNSFALNSSYLINGQSTGLVYTVYQGENSVWIGGETGFFRVTGSYTDFFPSSAPPFDGIDIEGVVEDSEGKIWLTTFGKGVVLFDPKKNEFEVLGKDSGLISEYCLSIATYENRVALNCVEAITLIDIDSFEVINIDSIQGERLTDIKDIKIDDKGTVFVLSDEDILFLGPDYVLEKTNCSFKATNPNAKISSFHADSNSTLWLSTNNSFFACKNNMFTFSSSLKTKATITKIMEYDENHILLFSDIFYLFNKTTHETRPLQNITNNSRVRIEGIYDYSLTKSGDFIFSAPLLGVATMNDLSLSVDRVFPFATPGINIQASLTNGFEIYFAYENSLHLYDLLSEELTIVAKDIGVVTGIEKNSNNDELLLGIKDIGVVSISMNKSTYEANSLFEIEEGIISDLKVGKNKAVYFSLLESNLAGVYLIKENKQISKISDLQVDNITISEQGDIYISTRKQGVLKLGSANYSYKHLKYGYINNCLVEDDNGVIWLCTDGAGLGYLDKEKNEVVFIDSKYTANSRHIRELVQDSEGFFWVMTNQGLVRYDHVNKSSIKLGKEDGIYDVDFEITASINLPDDKILVAGDTQNYIIDTKLANSFLNRRAVKTTEALIVGFEVLDGDGLGMVSRKEGLFRSLETGKPLELAHDELYFDLEFAANNFVDRKVLGFQYRLEGLDSNWVSTNSSNANATYSTLPSGEYVFQVRVVDPKSVSLQPINSLKIKVLPPFWQTWEAYVVYVLAAIFATISFFKYRTIQLEKNNTRLEGSILGRSSDLAMSQNKVAESLAHKEALYAHASHELRTPLALISGPIQHLCEVITNKSALQNLEIVKRNSMRLSSLVDQILELSKIDSVKSEDTVEYHLFETIDAIVASFKPAITAKKQVLKFENLVSGNAVFSPDSLEKIISNILVNAIKYSPPHSIIEVDAKIENQMLVIAIRDNGIGIDERNLNSIFDRYTRIANGSNSDGSGLGLAVVKELVTFNKGEVEVKSDLGSGTSFYLKLPIHQARTATMGENTFSMVSLEKQIDSMLSNHNEEPIAASSIINPDVSVLIVEDHKDMQEFLVGLLKDKYSCVTAFDGNEGFELAKTLVPNLIISDLMMPHADGFELASMLRENPMTCHIPIIMLTAKGDDSTRMSGWEHNVDDFISKPFSNNELLLRISNLLSIRHKISKKFVDPEISKKRNMFVLEKSEYYRETERRFFSKFVDWLENNFTNEQIKRKDAADALAVSERQLTRKLSALTDTSFNDLLKKYRLTTAQALLKDGRQITQVAYETGFSSPSYFSSCFKEEFGKSPKAYIESI